MSKLDNSDTSAPLTTWQKKQAAMLYFFSAPPYLMKLHRMVSDMMTGMVDPLLDMAKSQNRDKLLTSKAWGDRNTSQNWANNAWPFLKDLQVSLAQDIALRASNRFRVTSVNESLRGLYEFSLDWTTPGEERMIKLALSTISEYASQYDDTVTAHQNRWDDYCFAYSYPAFKTAQQDIPKFAVSNNVVGVTGQVPPQTGVYICQDDPHASLQFAWTENGGIKLRVANTFNEIGLAALAAVGREALWFDERKMLDFAMSKAYAPVFHNHIFLDGEPCPALAPSAVARAAFTTRPCKWTLVELLPGQFENLDTLAEAEPVAAFGTNRLAGGERCVEPGFYFTPSAPNSRRFFSQGEIVPALDSAYGITYWQRDSSQNK